MLSEIANCMADNKMSAPETGQMIEKRWPADTVPGIRASDQLIGQFNLRTILQRPVYLANSAWLPHIPVAFWLMEAQSPHLLVDLGAGCGVSYFAFCQAAERLDLTLRAFA